MPNIPLPRYPNKEIGGESKHGTEVVAEEREALENEYASSKDPGLGFVASSQISGSLEGGGPLG